MSGKPAEGLETLEAQRVADVRRGREQQHVTGAPGHLVRGLVAGRVAARVVRFVDHDDVPRHRGDGVEDVGLLEVVG